jgi:CheY-like chemotaxis protein
MVLTEQPDPIPVRQHDPSLPEGPAQGRPFILAVDDSPDMRQLLSDVLRPAGYTVVSVPSAARALSLMAERRPDLVITDLLMPGMSGFSLRSAMLKRPELAGIPVIILSGYWHRPSETLEASAVLSKPLNIDVLVDSVRRLLGA